MTSKKRSTARIGKHSSVPGDFSLELGWLMFNEIHFASISRSLKTIDLGQRAVGISDQVGHRAILSGLKRDVRASF